MSPVGWVIARGAGTLYGASVVTIVRARCDGQLLVLAIPHAQGVQLASVALAFSMFIA